MSRADVLVSADWAEENLNTPGVVFVEVDEDTSAYDGGHIAGAVKLDWKTELQDQVRRDFVSKEQFEQLLSAKGIGNDDTVVLYGGNNNWFAAYAYWYFKLYGHENVKLLDGGRKKWELDGRELSKDTVERAADDLHGQGPGPSIRAFRDEVDRRDRQQEPGRRPLARRVLRQAARAGAPAAGAVPARRAHPDRAERPVERRRPTRTARSSPTTSCARSTATRASTTAATPSPTAASASGPATPGSRCTSCSATRTSRTTTVRGPSTARSSASRSRRTSDMCGAPAQTPALPPHVDLDKETVIYGVVSQERRARARRLRAAARRHR